MNWPMFWYLTKINKIMKEDSFIQRLKKTNKPVHFVLLTLSFIIIYHTICVILLYYLFIIIIIIIICKTTETLIFKVNKNVVPGVL